MIWSPLPAGSPTDPQNRPRNYYPGNRWVDWAGTDFYSDNQDWKALNGLYNRYAGKPFAITEWGVSTGDDSAYVRKLMTWVRRHPRAKMLVYYQDFGSTSSYRIQNWPASLGVLRNLIHSGRFPSYAPFPPKAPPPPPGASLPANSADRPLARRGSVRYAVVTSTPGGPRYGPSEPRCSSSR